MINNNQTKFHLILLLNVFTFIYALASSFNLYFLIFGLILARFIGLIGIDLGMHRYFTHKSFQSKRWFENVMLLIGILNHQGSSIMFAGVHRMHHAHSDTEKDPHNGSWLKILFYIRHKNFLVPMHMIADLARNPLHRLIHKQYFKIHFALLLLTLLDVVVYGYTIGAIVTINWLSAATVNILSHGDHGKRNFDTKDKSTNTWIIQVWSWNEGLHNNHHYLPSAYDYAMKKGEIDLPAIVLRLLEKINIVTLNLNNKV